ncbi:hypothetical protein [Nocardioides sp. 616]|uniref:hypothetical protein n=1 Tax=Nocardioides sp. 616 TaxID=2268090 RepID=UPI000CE4619F|nr:hypothetical protein [Nocardioides sp. 616]
MTDDPDPQARPVPDDGEHDAVRRLLAASRVTAGVPDAVTARLDETLAGLVAERPTTGGEPGDDPTERPSQAQVVPLPHRRRRVLAWSVAAAAAVVVGGVAVGSLPTLDGSENDMATSDAGPSLDDGAGALATDPEAGQDQRGESPAPFTGAAALSSDSLERDLVLLRAAGQPQPAKRLAAMDCLPPAQGERFLVSLDGVAAVAVLGPVRGDQQRARVYWCESDRPVASALLPAP